MGGYAALCAAQRHPAGRVLASEVSATTRCSVAGLKACANGTWREQRAGSANFVFHSTSTLCGGKRNHHKCRPHKRKPGSHRFNGKVYISSESCHPGCRRNRRGDQSLPNRRNEHAKKTCYDHQVDARCFELKDERSQQTVEASTWAPHRPTKGSA